MNSKNNKNSNYSSAAQVPLMTFDDSNDNQNEVDHFNQSILNEFDPLTHDDNEIPWEYHWFDFVTFTRQYGFIEFISGTDNNDTDSDTGYDDDDAKPPTPIESGESDYDDTESIETNSDIESDSQDDLEYDLTLPVWTPVYPGKMIINHQDNNNEMLQNYCRFILMIIIYLFQMILFVSRQLRNNEN